METYTIRTNAHNSAIIFGSAEVVLAKWDQLIEVTPAGKFRIEDSKNNVLTIDELSSRLVNPPEPEPVKDNDDKVWPWDGIIKDTEEVINSTFVDPDSEFVDD